MDQHIGSMFQVNLRFIESGESQDPVYNKEYIKEQYYKHIKFSNGFLLQEGWKGVKIGYPESKYR